MTSLFPHGWTHYVLGGVSIGFGVSLLFALTGLIGGMSSVYTTTWSYVTRHAYFQHVKLVASREWRLAYAGGLIVGAAAWWFLLGDGERVRVALHPLQLFAGGLLVGYGARRSRGCTSGHGICGLASLQAPSLVAVLTFMATAFLAANLVTRVGGR